MTVDASLGSPAPSLRLLWPNTTTQSILSGASFDGRQGGFTLSFDMQGPAPTPGSSAIVVPTMTVLLVRNNGRTGFTTNNGDRMQMACDGSDSFPVTLRPILMDQSFHRFTVSISSGGEIVWKRDGNELSRCTGSANVAVWQLEIGGSGNTGLAVHAHIDNISVSRP